MFHDSIVIAVTITIFMTNIILDIFTSIIIISNISIKRNVNSHGDYEKYDYSGRNECNYEFCC